MESDCGGPDCVVGMDWEMGLDCGGGMGPNGIGMWWEWDGNRCVVSFLCCCH